MTDIGVYTQSFQAEDLSWDLTPPHGGFDQNGVIDVSGFTAAQHYPNGYIPSGTVLAKNGAGDLVPYLNSAADTTNTAVGILKGSITVLNPNGTAKSKVGCAYRVHGIVSAGHLPFDSTSAAAGGYIDAAGETDLKLIYFAA